MPRVGFEATTPVFEREKAVHALDLVATVIGPVWLFALVTVSYRTRWRSGKALDLYLDDTSIESRRDIGYSENFSWFSSHSQGICRTIIRLGHYNFLPIVVQFIINQLFYSSTPSR
jgi:hypothetical protein